MSTSPADNLGPLAGLTVVDLSRALSGPHATMLMADLGARVIKVEPPWGDEARAWGPPFIGRSDQPGAQTATYFLAANRNKESIVLDLKSPQGRDQLERLIERADVLCENFRPGVLESLGFDIARITAINPRLVVLRISGFGHDGPESARTGYDQILQGEAGLMSVTGPDPHHLVKVGVPIADILTGVYGCVGVLAALIERSTSGRGKVVRTSLLASLASSFGFQGTRATAAGERPQAAGNDHPSISPYGSFRCRDGQVQIAVGNDQQWIRLCVALDLASGSVEVATNSDRVRNRAHVTATIERATLTSDTEEILQRLSAAGIPCGRIRTLDEVYSWSQALSQRLVIDVGDEFSGPLRIPGSALRLFDGDVETTRVHHTPPPSLGADQDQVRDWASEDSSSTSAGTSAG